MDIRGVGRGGTESQPSRSRSTLAGDRRGQSVVLGAILVFALLVLGMGIYQATVVPNENEAVEFAHNQDVQGKLLDVRNGLRTSASAGVDTSTTVDLAPQYPPRSVFLNPGTPSGSLRTVGTTDSQVAITIANAEALDEETKDYLSGDGTEHSFGTGILAYQPTYNRYQNAPETRIDNLVVYNNFPDQGTTTLSSGQPLVDGRRITLVALDGDLSKSTANPTLVETKPISSGGDPVAITNGDDSVAITVRTQLDESAWVQRLLHDQIDDPGGASGEAPESGELCANFSDASTPDNERYVTHCDWTEGEPFNALTLYFEEDVVYRLSMAKVGVGTGATGTSAHYMTAVRGDESSVTEGGRQKVVFEVRDRYNNPVSGTTVHVEKTEGLGRLAGGDTQSIRTDADGSASVTYEAPLKLEDSPNEVTISAQFDHDQYEDAEPRERVQVDLRAINGSQVDRTQPLLNPNTGIIVEGATFRDGDCSDDGSDDSDCVMDLQLRNLDDQNREITAIRYAFYSADSQGSAGADKSSSLEIRNQSNPDKDLVVKGDFVELDPIQFSGDEAKTLTLHSFVDQNQDSPLNINEGEFFVIEIIQDGERTKTWFFAPGLDPTDSNDDNRKNN